MTRSPVGIGRVFGSSAIALVDRWEKNTDAGQLAKKSRLERGQSFTQTEQETIYWLQSKRRK